MLRSSTKEKFNKLSNYLNNTLGITPLSSYVDIEPTDAFLSDLENEYKLLRIKAKQIVNYSEISAMFLKTDYQKTN